MNTNYDLEVAFKNAVLKCIKDFKDVYQFPELDLTIKDVQLATFNVNYNKGDAILIVSRLDESISPYSDVYAYQFQCTFIPKLETTATQDTILIDILSIKTREYMVIGSDIDYTVHLEEKENA